MKQEIYVESIHSIEPHYDYNNYIKMDVELSVRHIEKLFWAIFEWLEEDKVAQLLKSEGYSLIKYR